MFIRLFLLFTIIPLIELYLLIKVGTILGAWETVGLVVLTALTGAILIKIEGFFVVDNMKDAILEKRFPADEIVNAVIVVICGALLITPGVITDIFSIFVLLPPGKGILREFIKGKIKTKIEKATVQTFTMKNLP